MSNIDTLYMHRPCPNCPMRKDCRKGWLGAGRMREILSHDTFVCHKDNSRQCAGHMLMRDDNNIFVRLAKIEEINLTLSGRELLFDTVEACIDHHKNPYK